MKAPFVVAAIAAALMLAGCTAQDEATVWTQQVDTPNGPVTCVLYDGYKSGGVSCNWASDTP